jgi:tryptophanyl-tRNA synthetase
MNKIVFSGIQPSGGLHIGNYLGAVKRWVKSQETGLNIFCVVDLHAITMPQEAENLKQNTLDIAALLIACGIDPEKSILFVQSHNPDHANLAWILNCFTSMGQLGRMTQYKEKSDKRDFVSVGLFDYPALMAADILLYNTTQVPVGEDQKQHVELARDIAQRFNSKYGETFVLPEAKISKTAARIMSLTDATKKMSKSDSNEASRIGLLESMESIRKKVESAQTDSGNEVKYAPSKPGISNLLEIYSGFSGEDIKKAEEKFKNSSYKDFKKEVADVVVGGLTLIQERFEKIKREGKLEEILKNGADKAKELSSKKLKEVKEKMGFLKNF